MGEVEYLVSAMTFAPLGVGLALATLTALVRIAGHDLPDEIWRGVGIGTSLFSGMLAIWMWTLFDPASTVEYQFLEFVPWIPEWGINYVVGIDGFSLVLIGLTTLLVPIVMVATWDGVEDRVRTWVLCLLTIETALIHDQADVRDVSLQWEFRQQRLGVCHLRHFLWMYETGNFEPSDSGIDSPRNELRLALCRKNFGFTLQPVTRADFDYIYSPRCHAS